MSMRDKIAKAILGGKTGGPTPSGIHVYHSSPHDFDRFDLSKIGTGEGAQVYGHGIYAAENPAVSGQGGQYWGQFTRKFEGPEYLAADKLKRAGFDRDAAATLAQQDIDALAMALKNGTAPAGLVSAPTDPHILRSITKNMLADRQAELDMLRANRPVGPRTYEVNFRAKPEELLDWDKPIAGQQAYDKLRAHWDARVGDPDIIAQRLGFTPASTGKDLYQAHGGAGQNYQAATETFADLGIPGIRYLDEGSRNIPTAIRDIEGYIKQGGTHKGAGADMWASRLDELKQQPLTHNYVAFDPSKLDIMAKYGVVGGVPLGAATMSGAFDPATYGERQ